MGKPNRGGLGKPLGWGEGWEGSHSAADSHIFFLEICREFGGHKNFVLHPNRFAFFHGAIFLQHEQRAYLSEGA
jgi:hypothetical protein